MAERASSFIIPDGMLGCFLRQQLTVGLRMLSDDAAVRLKMLFF
jgi:hypothetical protein